MLKLTDVSTYYGNIEALKGVSLEVRSGRLVCLIGANGAGKTTTLMTVCGINRAARGSIEFMGRPIRDLPPDKIVRAGISQVPEGRRVFPRLTVMENLEMGAFLRRDKGQIRMDLDRVFHLFPIIKERRKQLAGTLSGGEQQMLAIGRSLMGKPKLLLMDEPSLGLAPKLVEVIFEIIKEIVRQGTTIFLVEQNASMALSMADYGYVMETGRIVMEGEAQALLRDDGVRSAYLGE